MSTRLVQRRRAAELALARLERFEAAIVKAQAAVRDYAAELSASMTQCVEGMEDVSLILRHVCAGYGVSPAGVLSHVRTAQLVEPRHMVIAIAVVLTEHSRVELGRYLRRDHSALSHALAAHGRRLDTDRAYHARFDRYVSECDALLKREVA